MTSSPVSPDPIRVFHIGTFQQAHVSDHLRSKGMKQAGCEVIDLDYRSSNKRRGRDRMVSDICQSVQTWAPDIVLINKGELISPDVIRALKSSNPRLFVALFFGDQRGFCERSISRLGSVCDTLLINNADPVQVEGYRRLGCPQVITWHTASDTDIYRPVPPDEEMKCDVAFMGGNYTSFPDSSLRTKLMV